MSMLAGHGPPPPHALLMLSILMPLALCALIP